MMDGRLTNRINYLHDCLKEERSRAGIEGLNTGKVRKRRFIAGEERAARHQFASLDLPPSVVRDYAETAQLRNRDTDLLYGTLVLAGQLEERSLTLPILLYPVDVKWVGGEPLLGLNHGGVRVNPSLFTLFSIPAQLETTIQELLQQGELDLATPSLIAQELKQYLPEVEVSALEDFPNLASARQVGEASQAEDLSLLNASVLILAEKSKNVAGLLQEIEGIARTQATDWMPAFRTLLSDEEIGLDEVFGSKQDANRSVQEWKTLPAVLSEGQQSLLRSVNRSALTVCHGPPGTGKSFSIAAAALEQIVHGESVLIVTRSQEAADVIAEKIESLLPNSNLVIRAGRQKYLRQLKTRVDGILSRISNYKDYQNSAYVEKERTLNHTLSSLYVLEKDLRRQLKASLRYGHWFQEDEASGGKKLGLVTRLRKWVRIKNVKRGQLLADLMEYYRRLQQKRIQDAKTFHHALHEKRIAEALQDKATVKTLRNYRKALGHRYSAQQEEAMHGLDPVELSRLFPVWVTTSDDLHRVLPLQPGLFDLAIIDEATQCDLASALPVFFRGKRVLVTGDPMQLRHVSFLSEARNEAIAKQHGLSDEAQAAFHFRKVSLIDRVIEKTLGTSCLARLDEHFRSLPELIHFSNEHFYNGELKLMRESETIRAKGTGLQIKQVSGVRDAQKVNLVEIDEALGILMHHLNAWRGRSRQSLPSLGFLSPFRAQVDAFVKRARETLSSEDLQRLLKGHQLIAGTGHTFQGSERDVVILSMTLDPNSSKMALRFAERPDVFNVSITRARDRLEVLHSLDLRQLPTNSLLKDFLLQEHELDEGGRTRDREKEVSLRDLETTLGSIGWKSRGVHRIAGIAVDLLLEKGEQLIAIDLVGTGGDEGNSLSLEQSLLLNRTGIRLYPLGIEEWKYRQHEVIEFLNSLSGEA